MTRETKVITMEKVINQCDYFDRQLGVLRIGIKSVYLL